MVKHEAKGDEELLQVYSVAVTPLLELRVLLHQLFDFSDRLLFLQGRQMAVIFHCTQRFQINKLLHQFGDGGELDSTVSTLDVDQYVYQFPSHLILQLSGREIG